MLDRKAREERTLFLGNVAYEVSVDELRESFGFAGDISHVNLICFASGKPKGCAFIEFKTLPSAKMAHECLKKKPISLKGRAIRSTFARPLAAKNLERPCASPPPPSNTFRRNSDLCANPFFKDGSSIPPFIPANLGKALTEGKVLNQYRALAQGKQLSEAWLTSNFMASIARSSLSDSESTQTEESTKEIRLDRPEKCPRTWKKPETTVKPDSRMEQTQEKGSLRPETPPFNSGDEVSFEGMLGIVIESRKFLTLVEFNEGERRRLPNKKLMMAGGCSFHLSRIGLASEKELRSIAEAFGEVNDVDIPLKGGIPKGYANIEMSNRQSALVVMQHFQTMKEFGDVMPMGGWLLR